MSKDSVHWLGRQASLQQVDAVPNVKMLIYHTIFYIVILQYM